MIINRICQEVTSFYQPALFEIKPAPKEFIRGDIIVEIVDTKTNRVVGIKRFGTLPARINVAPYARGLVSVKPATELNTTTQFVEVESHSAQLMLRIGNQTSASVTLLPSKQQILDNHSIIPLYNSSDTFKIGTPNEYLFFAKENATPSALVSISTICGKEFSFSQQPLNPQPVGRVVRFILDPAQIEQKAAQEGVDIGDCTSIKVTLLNNGESFSEISLKLMPQKSNSIQLCWLNKMGGFGRHIFHTASHSNIEVSRSPLQSESDYRSRVSKIVHRYDITTDYLSEEYIDSIVDILYSEHIWIVSSGYSPAVIQSHKIVNHPNNLHSLSLTIATI